MTENIEQGLIEDINKISQSNQSSKEKVLALIELPFNVEAVPIINGYINNETTQPVECIDELNNIAICNEQILEFETLKSTFEKRRIELIEALMNRLEGVFIMNDELNQNVQPAYPTVEQPVNVQTPQVEEFTPVTPVESYAAPVEYSAVPEGYADPMVSTPVVDVPQMDNSVALEPVVGIPQIEVPVTAEPVAEVPEMGFPVTTEPVAEVSEMEVPVTTEPVAEVHEMEIPVTTEPVAEVSEMEIPVTTEPVAEESSNETVMPELSDDLLGEEAKSLFGVISPVEDKLPESSDLNGEDGALEVPSEETSEENTEETNNEEMENSAEDDAVVTKLKERYKRLLHLEIDAYKKQVLLDKLRSQIEKIEDQIATDQEEISSLKKAA